VLYEMVSTLALQLIQCDRSVLIDNETSKYPYIHEMLKYLVRYCDANYKLRDFETIPADTDTIIKEFVRNSMDKIANEEPVDTIMRWERHFRNIRGSLGSFGFIEFCVKYKLMVRFLIEVKQHLKMVNNSVTSCEGCYQACAELARAHQENIVTADNKCTDNYHLQVARLNDQLQQVKAKPAVRPSPEERRKKAEEVRAAESNTAAAIEQLSLELAEERETMVANAAMQPVYLALTDFSNWVFLKLQNKTITASHVLTPFPANTKNFTGGPDFLSVLQYMAHGLSIELPNLTAYQNRAQLISEHDASLAQKVILTVYSDAAKFVDTALGFVEVDQVKVGFDKKFPACGGLWDMIMASRVNINTNADP